jgi:hypothetical protein
MRVLVWNRTKKLLAIALRGVGGLKGRDEGGNVANVQYKSNGNCHYESPLNEYILIKKIRLHALEIPAVWDWGLCDIWCLNEFPVIVANAGSDGGWETRDQEMI